MSALPRVKCYFDIVCPNSWMTIQALNAHSYSFSKIEYEPVCDFKIGILHNSNIWNQRRKAHTSRIWKNKKVDVTSEPTETEGILRRIDERGKNLKKLEQFDAPVDWKETYKLAISRGSVVPQLYLTSIKQRYPELYENAIQHIGNRLWNQKKPVHYGCHMSTVSRELDIPFKAAEDIVSRLSTPENRNVLHQNCRDAVELKLTEAPGVILMNEDGEVMKYENITDLLASDMITEMKQPRINFIQ